MLSGTTRRPDEVIGLIPPILAECTVEKVAVNAVMAGCLPEYFPVVLSVIEAALMPQFSMHGLLATLWFSGPVVIVNGPIGERIRLNSGFGCLGPDPQRPAGASIGRALRLLQQNVGGALPGIGAMANYGGMRYTNAVFAEDEASLPDGWAPHGTERHGFPRGTDSISLVFANGVTNIKRRSAIKETPEEDVLQGMHRIADVLAGAQLGGLVGYREGTPGVLLIPQVVGAAAKVA